MLAAMVASAYNFGDKFVDVADPRATTPGSWNHGRNAAAIARDLFRFNLFGSPSTITGTSADMAHGGRHTVRQGDSLSRLARDYYDDMSLWPIIYEANLETIGADPNKLTIGQDLVMPVISAMHPADIATARQKASRWHVPSSIPVEPQR